MPINAYNERWGRGISYGLRILNLFYLDALNWEFPILSASLATWNAVRTRATRSFWYVKIMVTMPVKYNSSSTYTEHQGKQKVSSYLQSNAWRRGKPMVLSNWFIVVYIWTPSQVILGWESAKYRGFFQPKESIEQCDLINMLSHM